MQSALHDRKSKYIFMFVADSCSVVGYSVVGYSVVGYSVVGYSRL